METKAFTGHVYNIIARLKSDRKENPEEYIFSDIIDGDGNQYVDLVQQGGGTWGIALLGYLYVLEEMGIRFLNLAGTSAGAISTIFMAAAGDCSKPKTEKLINIIANKNLFDFVDGDGDDKFLIKMATSKYAFYQTIAKYLAIPLSLDELIGEEKGLNPGKTFEKWLADTLKNEFGVENTGDLQAKMSNVPKLFLQKKTFKKGRGFITEKQSINEEPKIKIIAADITTQTKVVFPEMAELYYKEVSKVNPSAFVRASMSIPFFFQPYEVILKDLPVDTEEFRNNWIKKTKFEGVIPQKVTFVDGGIMSNFPIDVFFEETKVSGRPIFGIRMGVDRLSINKTQTLPDYALAIFDGARYIRDKEFIEKNYEFEQLIGNIKIPNTISWLDFDLSDNRKLELFKAGAESAEIFLKSFTWEKFKRKRRAKLFESGRKSFFGLLSPDDIYRKFNFAEIVKMSEWKEKVDELFKKTPKFKMLWIDDEPYNDYVELDILEALNIQTVLASCSKEAEELLFKFKDDEKFDMIITDSFRDNNKEEGIDFIKEIMKEQSFSEIPVIFHSVSIATEEKNKQKKLLHNYQNTVDIRKIVHFIFDKLSKIPKNQNALSEV